MQFQAFGIGALEDEDDEDVYGVESLTSYDVALAGEGDITMERKYGWTGGPESGLKHLFLVNPHVQSVSVIPAF